MVKSVDHVTVYFTRMQTYSDSTKVKKQYIYYKKYQHYRLYGSEKLSRYRFFPLKVSAIPIAMLRKTLNTTSNRHCLLVDGRFCIDRKQCRDKFNTQ